MDNIPDINELNGMTPEQITNKIFCEDPKPVRSYQLLAYQNNSDVDYEYIFEILVTILLEALDIFFDGLDNAELSVFEESYVEALNPWFESFGYGVNIKLVDNDPNYYCRVILKEDKYKHFFDSKGITKNYHFLLNRDKPKYSNIDELILLFSANDKIYSIYFNNA